MGWALLGLVMWGVAAVVSLLAEDANSAVLDLLIGLVAVVGIAVALVGLVVTAWRLIRS